MKITRAELDRSARDLNEVLDLSPAIDVLGPRVGELRRLVAEAATLLRPGDASRLAEETRRLVAAIRDEVVAMVPEVRADDVGRRGLDAVTGEVCAALDAVAEGLGEPAADAAEAAAILEAGLAAGHEENDPPPDDGEAETVAEAETAAEEPAAEVAEDEGELRRRLGQRPRKPREVKKPREARVLPAAIGGGNGVRRNAPIVKKYGDADVIALKVADNPKKPGAASYDRFALYRNGMTCAEFLAAGGTRADLSWDRAHGFVEISASA